MDALLQHNTKYYILSNATQHSLSYFSVAHITSHDGEHSWITQQSAVGSTYTDRALLTVVYQATRSSKTDHNYSENMKLQTARQKLLPINIDNNMAKCKNCMNVHSVNVNNNVNYKKYAKCHNYHGKYQ